MANLKHLVSLLTELTIKLQEQESENFTFNKTKKQGKLVPGVGSFWEGKSASAELGHGGQSPEGQTREPLLGWSAKPTKAGCLGAAPSPV